MALRGDFGLFRDLLGGSPWETALERREVQEIGLIFKHDLLHSQEWSMAVAENQANMAGGLHGWPRSS